MGFFNFTFVVELWPNMFLSKQKPYKYTTVLVAQWKKFKDEQIEQKKTFTNRIFQFHFCCRVMAKYVLVKTETIHYSPGGPVVQLSVF